jgi:MEMO1 family protein
MPVIRPAAVAGTFYPSDPNELARDIDALLSRVPRVRAGAKAVVAPHAGYIYSGPIAASAFAALGDLSEVTRIIVLGPAHRVRLRGLAGPGADALATPLGELEVDRDALARAHIPDAVEVHRDEHALEVELPFLRRLAPHAQIVPIAVGTADPDEVATALDALWGGPETRIVVSSDLSHYLPYAEGRATDERTAQAVLALRDDALDGHHACGHVALAGLLRVARRRGLTPEVLDLRSSGDTRGSRSEVVGYGAFAFHEPRGGRDGSR